MARSTVTVENVMRIDVSSDGDITYTPTSVDIIVDDDFMIDGVAMPRPSQPKTDVDLMMTGADRLPGNGEFVGEYLGVAFNTKWTYSELNAAEYKWIYDNYVQKSIDNKTVYHKIKTRDLKLGVLIEKTIYTQAKIEDKSHHIGEDGYMRFWDVLIDLTDKAGEV